MPTPDDTLLVRVERGLASKEELAALTAAFLARATARRQTGAARARITTNWRRLERHPYYESPSSWQRMS